MVRFSVGFGPFRISTGGRLFPRPRRRRKPSRQTIYSHAGCDVKHRTRGAAERCGNGVAQTAAVTPRVSPPKIVDGPPAAPGWYMREGGMRYYDGTQWRERPHI